MRLKKISIRNRSMGILLRILWFIRRMDKDLLRIII